MKKSKVFIIIISVAVVISSTVLYFKKYNAIPTDSVEAISTEKKAELSFFVLGDVHGNIDKLNKAIIDLYSENKNADALVLNGDNVDQGTPSHYEALKSALNKNKKYLPKIIIKNIGNHEYFDYLKGQNGPEDLNNFKNNYYDFSGEKSVYHDKWINGYHFISLGSESDNMKGLSATSATLSKEQFSWLKVKLGEKYEKGKPVFVFLHQHLNTSIQGWTGVVQRKELVDILSKYPEVILFTSHTHVLLSIDNIKLNQPFSIVHTGAVTYAILPENYKVKRLYGESQGLYVEVNKNKVVVKGRDFAKKTWIFSKEISK